jgi:hypothetical protein
MLSTLVRLDESTLRQVADRLRLLYELLLKANPQIKTPDRLTPGQEVFYPKHPFSQQQPPATAAVSVAPTQGDRTLDRQLETGAQQRSLDSSPPRRLATIPPFDPRKGPQITNDMWTDEMLDGEVTEAQLRNVADPAGFLNARLARLQKPTNAIWINHFKGDTSAVNPSHMSTREAADAMLKRLQALGLRGGQVEERVPSNAVSRIDYKDDPRRHFYIGNLSVGLLLERYAKYPREMADRMTLAELHEAGSS